MGRLRSDKVRQLGGIICLAVFLYLVAGWLEEDTDENKLVYVIVGAVLASSFGYWFSPWLLARLRRRPRHQRRSRSRGRSDRTRSE